jgi:16S rRNA (cytosine967-C5)-methyltransferase
LAGREIGPARRHAFRILLRVDTTGAYASILLDQLPVADLDRRDVRLITELVLGTLRWRGRLDHALEQVSSRRLAAIDPAVRTALRLAAHQILFLDRIPDAAAVNGSVQLARQSAGARAAGFANGVLRSLCRGRESGKVLEGDPDDPGDWPVLYSHPGWLIDRWIERMGRDDTRALLEANNRPAPVVLRPIGEDAGRLADRLRAEGVEAEPSPMVANALRLVRGNPFRTRTFEAGGFYAIDEASQLVPRLFGDPGGDPVLDLCAAPGGKAIVLASHPSRPLVIAADRHEGRLRRLRSNRERLGLENLLLLAADFATGSAVRQRFRAVLVDAPCSGTGTLRRHPEIRWRLQPGDLDRLVGVQKRLLEAAAHRVAPGGTLVYSVCSLEPEEGERRVDSFLAGHTQFRRGDVRSLLEDPLHEVATRGPDLMTFPHRGGLDGFFAARLERRTN